MISFRKLFLPSPRRFRRQFQRDRQQQRGADRADFAFRENCALARGNDAGSARPGHAKPAWRRRRPPRTRWSRRSIACAASTASSGSRCRCSSRPQVFARSIGETTDVVSKEMYSFEDRGGEFAHAAARVHRRHLPRLSDRRLAAICAAEGRDARPGVPLRAAAEGPLPPVPPARRRDHRRRPSRRPTSSCSRFGRPAAQASSASRRRDAAAQHARRCGDARRLARRAGRAFRGASRRPVARTARSGSSGIRCASSTARTPRDRPIVDGAPAIDDFLTAEAADFFGQVTAGSTPPASPGRATPRLVRGLDYYRHTAFEFVTDRLGAQGTVLAGGRYDGLIESARRPAHAGGRLGGRDRAAGDADRRARAPRASTSRSCRWRRRGRCRRRSASLAELRARGHRRRHGAIAATPKKRLEPSATTARRELRI